MKNLSLNEQSVHIGHVVHSVQLSQTAAGQPVRNGEMRGPAAQAYERGFQEGHDETRRELMSAFHTVIKMSDNLQRQSNEMKRAVDRVATVLAMRIAAKIIGREISKPETLKQMISQALAQVPVQEQLSVRINPLDLQLLSQLGEKPIEGNNVVLVADPSIHSGGCIIESSVGCLDARVETQMAMVEKSLGLG